MIQWAYEIQFIIALFFTLSIEIPVLWCLLRFWIKEPEESLPILRILAAGIFATMATLPYVWFVLPYFFRSYLPYIITGESFAVIAETVLYIFFLRLKPTRAFIVALVCNGASFFAGEVLKMFL